MRSPIEDEVLNAEAPEATPGVRGTPAGRPAKRKPPGGKALLRVELFSQQRNLQINPEVAPLQTEATPSVPKARSRRKASRGAAAAADETGVDPVLFAQEYADAAIVLQSKSRSVEIAPLRHATAAPAVTPPPSWRPLGPTYMPNGQTYGASRVDVAGRVAALAINPTNRDHILVGSAAGGVWESKDRGASWTPRTDTMPTLTIGAVAFVPSNPQTIYAGTGEGNFYARLGAGLLRSTDGGTTWSLLTGNPFVGQGFYDLIIDPANANHLVSATTGGIHESTNAGVNWTQRRVAPCWDLSMHPTGGASAEVLAACSDGLFRSTNGGQTWAAVTLPGAAGAWDRLAVAHARSNPAIAYIFGSQGGTPRLFRRNSSGTFQAIAPPPSLSTNQAWYDWFLAVAPDAENRIYIGAIDAYRGEVSGTTAAWTNISSKPSGDSIHPDQHAVTFDPSDPNIVYIGNDGGLYRSTNRGTNWQALNRGLAITELEYVAQDYGLSRWVVSGTQDNGSVRYTGTSVWDHVADGDGGDCTVNRANPNTVFHSFFGMGMERSTTKGSFGSFSWIGPNVPNNYQALFYPPMESCNDVIAQAGQSVFVSRNDGTNFTEIALPTGCVGSAMYMPTTNKVFVGCTNGRIFRLDWTGAAWSAPVALTTPRNNAYVSDLFVAPNNLNRIWATHTTISGGRVFRSDNGGTSWTDRSAGLPPLPINAIEVDPDNASRVWVAADIGVYQSLDAGGTWSAFSLGLPNVLVADLLFHPHTRVLRAGTRNRGGWEIPVDGWLTQPICGVQFTGTLAGSGQQKWYTFNWPATWHVFWTVMPTTVQPGGPQVSWTVEVERANAEYATYWINVKNLKSTPVTFEGRFAILSRY
jgi:hypothetical protein